VLPHRIRLHEHSPVLSLNREKTWCLRTPDAEIRARTVILATNAAVKHFGYWRDGLVTIYTYAALTEPMTPSDAATLGSPAWGVLPAHRLGTTLRRVGSDRHMVRSLYAYEAPLDPALVRAALTGCFHRRYPHLSHVGLEHVWGGTTALTMNGSPRWGRLDEGLYASAGCNGSGLVKGTVLGKRLAEMIVTGDPQEELQAVFGSASRIAPEPFRSVGFKIISAIERRKAGAEM
jgi:glycine/D-amino acid oxidase-like deaminating enzyme